MDSSMRFFRTLVFTLSLLTSAMAAFLWFEKSPDPNDRCTTMYAGLNKSGWQDFHPPTDCLHGGLLWFYTTGRIHGHYFIDPTREQDFELCLTAGEANSIYIWHDHQGKYWEPMGFPNFQIGIDFKERCRKSVNGTMNLFFESPWYKLHYVSHVSWEITPLPLGTNTLEEEPDFSDLPAM